MDIRLRVFLNACLLANLIPISTETVQPPKSISSLSLELMEQQNGKKFYSIVVICDNFPHDNLASNSLREEMMLKVLKTNQYFWKVLDLKYLNLSENAIETLERYWTSIRDTLFLILDFKVSYRIRKFLFQLREEYIRSKYLMLINPYEESELSEKEEFNKGMQYWHEDNATLDTKLFILNGNQTEATLLEVYKTCTGQALIISEITRIYAGKIFDEKAQSIWERRKDLNGCQLRICYVDSFPENTIATDPKELKSINPKFTLISGNETMYGGKENAIELIKLLAYDLNFTISWVKAEDNSYGVYDPEKKVWNGLIGLLVRDRADFCSSRLIHTSARSKVISFTTEIEEYQFGLFMASPSVSPSWYTFLDVFDYWYWCAIMIIFVSSSLVLTLFFFKLGEAKAYKATTFFQDLASSTSVVLLSLVEFDMFPNGKRNLRFSNALRIMILIISYMGWLIKEAYNGGLISSLVYPRLYSDISSLEDLLIHPEYQLVLLRGTASIQQFRDHDNWPYTQIWNQQLNDNPKAFVDSRAEAEKGLLADKRLVYFDLINIVESSFENYPCNIIRSWKTYFHSSAAMALQKNSQYLSLFNYRLRLYRETGILLNMASLKRYSKGGVDCQAHQTNSIGYQEIFSGFVFLITGISLALIIVVVELLILSCKVLEKKIHIIHF